MHRLLTPKGKLFLLGDEAVVRGALEAGIGFSSTYPGTPASEIGDAFCEICKEAGVYSEYSPHEKTAAEAAAGAAFSGLRSMVSFKHFGFNVATDSIFPLSFYGVKGGMVIVYSDDPNCWSSGQSEQDTRPFAKIAHMPMLEPSDPQEAKDFTKLAFEMSEKFHIPVILRLTTRVCYSRGTVKLGPIINGKKAGQGVFTKENRWHTMPPKIVERHAELHDVLKKIEEWSEKTDLHLTVKGKRNDLGIITSGVSFNYVMETLDRLGLDLPVLKVSMYPYPKNRIRSFISGFKLKQVLVVEELEGFLENEVKAIESEMVTDVRVRGKDLIPAWGEMRIEKVVGAIGSILGLPVQEEKKTPAHVFKRDPILCPGCPHRASFWNAKTSAGKDMTYAGDIGCYILGIYKPIEMQDYIIAMGAGTGISHGISKATGKPVITVMGDSTFFHAGMPAILNAAYNDSDLLIMVLDNGITAMTGQQPNAGMGVRCGGEAARKASIEEVAKALGAEVYTVNPFDTKKMQAAIIELLKKKGPKVLIARQPCRLMFMRNAKKNKVNIPVFEIDQKKCKKCDVCVQYGCPAIHVDMPKKHYYIDPDMCWGCTVCSQICPYNAIGVRKKPEQKK